MRGSRRLGLLGVVAAVVLACGAAYAWQWHTRPSVFPGAGNRWSGPLPNGTDFMIVGITGSDLDAEGATVVLDSAEPRIRKNSGQATYEFYVCTTPDGARSGQLGMLAGQRAFDRWCPDAERVRKGTRLHTGADPAQQLVMLVRMPGPGVSSTTGVELTYSHGWQRGTQLIGPEVRVTRERAGSP